jgi:chromate transporter
MAASPRVLQVWSGMRAVPPLFHGLHSQFRHQQTVSENEPTRETATHYAPPFFVFGRIGLTSFGGGLSGWLLREFVQDRRWLSHDEFMNGLAIAQALPGVNVSNMAIWIGYRLCGWSGAVAGLIGIILPPAAVIIVLGTLLSSLTGRPMVHLALEGATAAAIGLSLSMGITTARHVPHKPFAVGILAATFVALGVLRLPLVHVLVIVGTISVAVEYVKLSDA